MNGKIVEEKKTAAIGVVDFSTRRILMIQREGPNPPRKQYAFITETYEPEEDRGDLSNCAARGLAEEVNVQVNPDRLVFLDLFYRDSSLKSLFALPLPSAERLTLHHQLSEVADTEWVRPGEFLFYIDESPDVYRLEHLRYLRSLLSFMEDPAF